MVHPALAQPALAHLAFALFTSASPEVEAYERALVAGKNLPTEVFLKELPRRNERAGLSFDPTKVEHFDRFLKHMKPTPEELELYKKNGFVMIDHARPYSFGSAYFAIYTADLPVLITTDSIAYAVHKSFDDILIDLELGAFMPALQKVLDGADKALAQKRESEAKRDVRLYLAVAKSLLAGKATGPEVDVYLEKAKKLELETPDHPKTELYGSTRAVDWSQFQPRGHYTKSLELERYFKAMMWLGRADCAFRVDQKPRERAAARLFADTLTETKLFAEIDQISEAIEFFVGKKDGLDLADFAAGKTIEQSIRSESIPSSPLDAQRSKVPVIVNLFPQRFVIDSYALAEVVFDSIVFEGQKMERYMPSGLDAIAALGNDLAAELLAPELHKWKYAANLRALRTMIAGLPNDYWEGTLYNLRLDAGRSSTTDLFAEKHAPQAMKTRAWRYRQLEAQLAAWAELRHDTIVYAKQSYTAFATCEYPAGYVEPYPAFYRRARRFADEAARRLGPMGTRQLSFFRQMSKTMGTLEKLAEKELRAEPFTTEEKDWLKQTIDIRGGGSGPPTYSGWYPTLFYRGGDRAEEWDPIVSDVHTDPNSKRVLQVAAGSPTFLAVAVDNQDDRMVYVGPAASYYEFTRSAGERLTDEAWQLLLSTSKQPPRPEWTKLYRSAPSGREVR